MTAFNIYRQERYVGSAEAADAIAAIDLYVGTADEKNERRLLPGPYMAIAEAEDWERQAWVLECRFHVWQMNDGRWHYSPYTEHRNNVPLSWMDNNGFDTEAEAKAGLREWARARAKNDIGG